jgi:serralysin
MPKPTTSNKIINGTSGDDALYGDLNGTLMQKHAHGGNDILNGGDGNDTLYGDAYEMHQNSVGGNDTLDGGSGGGDNLYGDALIMDGNAQGGNDTITATASAGAPNTFLFGCLVSDPAARTLRGRILGGVGSCV